MFASYKKYLSIIVPAIIFASYCTPALALDLRRSTSPFVEDGTNISMAVQRNMCIGTAAPLDALSLCTSPVADATRGLLNLSNTALSAGSASGTFISGNPLACAGDFLNLQVGNAARAKLTCAGALTLASTISATQYTSTIATGTAPFVVSSTTQVGNLNVSQLVGATWVAPGTIGSSTPNTGAFTTLSATSTFTVSGSQANAIGGSTDERDILGIKGSYGSASGLTTRGIRVSATLTPLTGADAYGIESGFTATRPAGGTIPLVAGIAATAPTLNGTGAATVATALYVSGAPTGATSNYALFIDAGQSRFDDDIIFNGTNTTAAVAGVIGSTCPAVTCTAAYTWVRAVSNDGSTVYFPVWK